jgi:hypothetical protein
VFRGRRLVDPLLVLPHFLDKVFSSLPALEDPANTCAANARQKENVLALAFNGLQVALL